MREFFPAILSVHPKKIPTQPNNDSTIIQMGKYKNSENFIRFFLAHFVSTTGKQAQLVKAQSYSIRQRTPRKPRIP
ncbi:MAG: hypothetical protein EAZ92_07140 [Candidatus Kapaibacterium sp.]|nr:MAG: hypothetical protein EAZ92_07140 [Candidatus Kapabacteria bacterium]